ncbi:hypothetical protein [Streptomyces sp. NPDC001450]
MSTPQPDKTIVDPAATTKPLLQLAPTPQETEQGPRPTLAKEDAEAQPETLGEHLPEHGSDEYTPGEDAEPDEEYDQEDDDDQEDEQGPGLLIRLYQEVIGPLELREFFSGVVDDFVVGTVYLVRKGTDWVFAPEGEDAWKKIGLRALVIVGPGFIIARAIFVSRRGELVPVTLFAWVIATWLVAAAAHRDAKRRRKEKKRKEKEKRKAQEKKGKKGKKNKKEVDQETGEQGSSTTPQPPSEEEIRARVALWIRQKIQENPHGNNGIHLGPLYDAALKEGWTTPETDRPTFRKVLEHRGIKTGQVNVGGKNLTGVKAKDVPAARPGDPDWKAHASVTRHLQKTPE